MRLAHQLIGLCVVVGSVWLAIWPWSPQPRGENIEEAVIDLTPKDDWRSPLGLFPPTEVIDQAQLSRLGVKMIDPAALDAALPIETRRTPDGSYITQIGEALFLTQRLRTSSTSTWTLRAPPGAEGTLRVVAVPIAGRTGLGIERPGDFARLAWSDGRWSYVFFDIGNEWGIERLVSLAESLR